MAKPKLPPRRIKADGIEIEAEMLRLNVGEWVDVVPIRTLGQQLDLARAGDDKLAKGDQDGYWAESYGAISQFIAGWNLTSCETGEPLPPPNTPGVHLLLHRDQIRWLYQAARDGKEPTPVSELIAQADKALKALEGQAERVADEGLPEPAGEEKNA